jgi:hypothetical protein
MSAADDKRHDGLAQLAEYCGISAGYEDVWGKAHATSEKTQRTLLAAMHFPADADPEMLLQGLQDDEWRRPLPPVKVVALGETPTLAVTLPVARASQPHRWILSAENGASSSGEFEPAKLPRLGEQRVDGVDFLRGELVLPPPGEAGYYRLEVEQPGSRWPGAGGDDPGGRPGELFPARRRAGRRSRLGADGATLRSPFAAQLGDRRLRRPAHPDRSVGGRRRRSDRRQSAARPVSRRPGADQPLQPIQPLLRQRAVHRCRSRPRVQRVRGRPQSGRLRAFPGAAATPARR